MNVFARSVARRIAGVIALVPAIVLRLLRVRFLPVRVDRIGHLALDLDSYVKEERLALHTRYRAVLCAPADKVANRRLVDYWSPFVATITSPLACLALKPLAAHGLLRFDTAKYATAISGTAAYPAIQKQWGNRRPLLSLRDEDAVRGEECLRQLGIPRGAWFVCVHNREGGWSPADEHLHSYRNSKLASYVPAMRAIVERGGWCVRVGDPSMSKLPAMRNVVDYAHHPLRADWMDLVLCARCRFFLGNTSGPFLLSSVFGVAVALANLIPLSVVLPFGRQDLGIPKLLRQRGTARLLTFEEILSTAAGNYRFASQYREAGLEIRDNSPEEITELALEQLDCIEGRVVYTREDETLQSRFKALMKPGHYTYGSESRVGRDFLRRYAGLLPPTPG